MTKRRKLRCIAAIQDQGMRNGQESKRTDIEGIVSALSLKKRLYAIRGAAAILVTAVSAMIVVLPLSFHLVEGWRYAPLAIFIFFWAVIAGAVISAAAWIISLSESIGAFASSLGKEVGTGSLFSSALEFSHGGKRLVPYSPFLLEETVRRAEKKLSRLSPLEMFGEYGRPAWLAAAVAVSLLAVLQASLDPGGTSRAILMVSDPALSFRERPGFNLVTQECDLVAVAGEDIRVDAFKMGGADGEVRIRYSQVPDVWRTEAVHPDTVYFGNIAAERFSYLFRGLKEDVIFYFEGGEEKTAEISIDVIHRPVINGIGAVMAYPGYTGAPPDTVLSVSGRIVALSGTRVELFAETSKEIIEGNAVFSSGRKIPVTPDGKGFRCSFDISRDDTVSFRVAGPSGLWNESPLEYPVRALRDEPPAIEIISPRDEAILPRSMLTTLSYRSVDDYGISSVVLKYKKEKRDSEFKQVSVAIDGKSSVVEDEFEWSLEGDRVFPGDRIVYYLEALDNNSESGPGYSRTPQQVLVVPSLSDIYAEARRDEEYQAGNMEDILEESAEVRDRLRELAEDLRSEGEMDWNRRKEGADILDAQRELQKKIKETTDRLDEALEKLEQNRMTSMEVGKKMEEIQDLLREIENEDLRSVMEKFREMMSDMPDSELASAMEDIEIDTEKMNERLDRTIELLKQVLREEKMEELVRRMEEMLAEQESLKDSTEAGDLDKMTDRQEDLEEEYGDFEDSLEKFASENSESDAGSEMEELAEMADEAQIDSMMRMAISEMEADERSNAVQTQNETVERMRSLYTEMGRCQMAVSMKADLEGIRMVEKAARDLIEISKLHEGSMAVIPSGMGSAGLEYLLSEQNEVREAIGVVTKDLMAAGRRSMAVSNEVFMHIGSAIHMINLTMEAMENMRFSSAALTAVKVPEELNLAVIELLKSSSSSGSGRGSAMQKMKMMLQQQSSIDEQLRKMLSEGKGGMNSMEARAKMARIAAEQRKIDELMQQMEEESRGRGELLGRLDDLGSEIKKIAESLERGELDENLVKREERILSRMLESQRSLNRRDYKRERVSRTAQDMRAAEAGSRGEAEREADILLERIRRAMKEKGPAEYEALIKAYFRALSEIVREEEK